MIVIQNQGNKAEGENDMESSRLNCKVLELVE